MKKKFLYVAASLMKEILNHQTRIQIKKLNYTSYDWEYTMDQVETQSSGLVWFMAYQPV